MVSVIEETEKLYYSITEVAEMLDVNTSLIRFWEKEFDSIKPTKNKKGNRLFTKKEIENIKHIYHLVKEKGYTLQGAKENLKTNNNNSSTEEVSNHLDVIHRLKAIKAQLLNLKEQL